VTKEVKIAISLVANWMLATLMNSIQMKYFECSIVMTELSVLLVHCLFLSVHSVMERTVAATCNF